LQTAFFVALCTYVPYAVFTLGGFDDQERNLTFVKTAFQVLKLQFLEQNIARD